MEGLKRFLKNKNTVTIIGVVAILAILFLSYQYQLNRATNPIRGVPIAAVNIQPRTEITAEMVEYIDIPPSLMKEGVVTNRNAIVGMFSHYNTVIPQGSLFYQGVLIEEKDLPDTAFTEVEEGDIPYSFRVNIETTFGNSIFPGNIVDIYMKAEDETGRVMVGRFLKNVKVLAVKDSRGDHVFENTEANRTPNNFIIGVDPEIHILLRKADYLRSVELFPVPRGGEIIEEGELRVSIQELKDYINARTVQLPLDYFDDDDFSYDDYFVEDGSLEEEA